MFGKFYTASKHPNLLRSQQNGTLDNESTSDTSIPLVFNLFFYYTISISCSLADTCILNFAQLLPRNSFVQRVVLSADPFSWSLINHFY